MPKTANEEGQNPLMFAVDSCKMLLEHGTDPTIEDVDGDTGHTLALENKEL